MRFFLAGIMQGSHVTAALHDQDYRQRLEGLLAKHLPGATVYDPLADHRNSLDYDADRGREVFFHHLQLCREVDVVLAFAPEASMGTAIEMWEAYRNGRVVITVSPMKLNWAVKFLSHQVYADLDEFEQALTSGQVARGIDEVLAG
jgi:hypothetical protein